MKYIDFNVNNQKFKYRVHGIIIHNKKVLTLKKNNQSFYYLPGEHVELCETSKDAILREMLEETKIKVSIKKELAIVENFYIDTNDFETHELCFYYLVTPENINKAQLNNYSVIENDKGELKQHNFEWLDISSLNNVDFRPSFIKSKLVSGNFAFEHVMINKPIYLFYTDVAKFSS